MQSQYQDNDRPRRRRSSAQRSSAHESTRRTRDGQGSRSRRTEQNQHRTRKPAKHRSSASASSRRRPEDSGRDLERRSQSRSRHSGSQRPRSSQRGDAQRQRTQRGQEARRPNGRNPRQQTRRASANSPLSNLPFSPRNLVLVAVCAFALTLGGCFLFDLVTRFNVTVNGQEVTLGRGSTVMTLIDEGYVSPTPGDLRAVDGSLLEKGKGYVCTATIDGKEASSSSTLSAGNVVVVEDGTDATEEATVTEEAVPYGKANSDLEFSSYWNGSIHLLADGTDGVKTVSTGNVSGKTVEEVTKEPIDEGYHIYTAQPDDKVIALTFDDGPWETTDDVLDILEKYDAKATFFTIGNQIDSFPDQIKRAYKMGCEVCTHTWDHAEGSGGGTNITNMSADEQRKEIQKGYDAIEEILGIDAPHIIRAPGGNFYGDCITNLWDLVDAEIGWDVDTEDWKKPGSDAIAEMILSAKPGQVVLMHDGGGDRTQTVKALEEALPQLVEDGYKFVTVSELLEYGLPSTSKKSDIPSTKSSDDDDDKKSDTKDEEEDDTDETSTSTSKSKSKSTDKDES